MLKKIVDKRIEQFKKDFPEHKVSKGGNLFYAHNEHESEMGSTYTVFNVTKGTIKKLGQAKRWTVKKSQYVFLITPTGRMMIKSGKSNRFKQCSMKDTFSYPSITNTFFIGRKYEYLKAYPNLHIYNFFQGFTTLKDAKVFLGFDFISDSDFYNMFPTFNGYRHGFSPIIMKYVIESPDEEKPNLVALLSKAESPLRVITELEDYHDMAEKVGLEKKIPAGRNKLRELHDEATDKFNEGKADNYSDEVEYKMVSTREDKTTFEDDWKERGLVFVKLDTPRKLFLEGIKQKHCIGNYGSSLYYCSFYRIMFNDELYNVQIQNDGNIRQFYGYMNRIPPKELTDIVYDSNINYQHLIRNLDDSKVSGVTSINGVDFGGAIQGINVIDYNTYATIQHRPDQIYLVTDDNGQVLRYVDGNGTIAQLTNNDEQYHPWDNNPF